MDSEFSDSSDDIKIEKRISKKRLKTGRERDVLKKLRATTHELGPDCKCKRYRCFQNITDEEKKRILREFNNLGNYNDQSKYLCGLITVLPVMRRRTRLNDDDAQYNFASYAYRVRVFSDGKLEDTSVCIKAFMSLHGISAKRVQTLRESLSSTGIIPIDKRGKHNNRPRKLSDEILNNVENFLKSLKGRKSHYSLKDSKKTYLPETLNIKKLHSMFENKNPENKISYESFRNIFETKFNISFGYPRKDTCSLCDILKAEIATITEKLKNATPSSVPLAQNKIEKELNQKVLEKNLHLRKAEKFYKVKRNYRKKSMKTDIFEAISMDYQKNLPTPNITTNDAYYRRQLNFITFNVHILSSGQSIFYTYDESVAKKGADDVCSMMHNFVYKILPAKVRQLVIFCDSCAGQNKNLTVFRFFHYLVTQDDRFDLVKMVFPIRGHSYLECDRNMSLVNCNSYTETPDDWREILLTSRIKPSPFTVVDCEKDVTFQSWTEYLEAHYSKKCNLKTRPIRVVEFRKQSRALIFHKDTYSGMYASTVIRQNHNKRGRKPSKNSTGKINILKPLYEGKLPIKNAKHKDLLHLKKFLMKAEAHKFYENLKTTEDIQNSEDEYIDNIPLDED